MTDEEIRKLVEQFIEGGGKIIRCPPKKCAIDEAAPRNNTWRAQHARMYQRSAKFARAEAIRKRLERKT